MPTSPSNTRYPMPFMYGDNGWDDELCAYLDDLALKVPLFGPLSDMPAPDPEGPRLFYAIDRASPELYVNTGTEWRRVDEDTPPVRSVAANTTAVNGETLLVNAATAPVVVTLPPPGARTEVTVKKTDNVNTVTVASPGAQTIDGAGEHVMNRQYQSRTIASDGQNYFIV